MSSVIHIIHITPILWAKVSIKTVFSIGSMTSGCNLGLKLYLQVIISHRLAGTKLFQGPRLHVRKTYILVHF